MGVHPEVTEVGLNTNFTVNITVTNPANQKFDSAGTHLDFNPDYIEVLNITNGELPIQLMSEFNNTAGTIDHDAGILGGTTTASSVLVCTIQMRSKDVSGSSPLDFVYIAGERETIVLLAGESVLNWAMVVNGTVTVGTPKLTAKLTVNVSPADSGDVKINGVTPFSYPNTTSWNWDDVVTLEAVNSTPGWGFVHWSGIDNNAINPTNITMDGDYSIVAHFNYSRDEGEKNYYLSVDMLGNTSKWQISQSGNLEQPVKLSSEDGKVIISLGKDVSCLDKDGNRLAVMSISEETDLPALPENHYIIGKAYKLEPSGAKFNPHLSLTLSYEDDDIPQYVFEEDICIAYYNVTNESWTALSSQVDTQNNTVTSRVSHFTAFAIMGNATSVAPVPAPAAEFTLTSLNITPGQVEPGQPLTISIQVANIGGSEGNYTVVLKIDNIEEARKEVTLGVGEFETVNFTTARDAVGSYIVTIDGQSGQFIVTAPSWLPQYWWIIATVCIGIGILICLLIIRRRRAF